MQDVEIIDLYFARDERAISETATKYGSYCTKIAYNILYDSFDAEECVNDTYMKAWGAMPPTRPSILSAFLAKITRNLALDRYKSAHSRKRGGRIAQSLDELSECVGESGVWSELEVAELSVLISKFLKNQKELVRRVFVRRYFYENSIEEIAKLHGISESRVKTMLFRARASLAEYLSREGVHV